MSDNNTGELIGGPESSSSHRSSSSSIAVVVESSSSSSQRKRHSAHGSDADANEATLSQVKIRKTSSRTVISASTCATESTSNSSSSANRPTTAAGPASSAQGVSSFSSPSSSSLSSVHKKNLELRFLTDFFPDQNVESGPLTRSKTRSGDSSSKRTSASTPSSSATPLARNRSTKKARKHQQPIVVLSTPPQVATPQARSPTPDPSSSNLTVAGSEASGFSFASSFASEVISTSVDSSDLRNLALDGAAQSVAHFGLLNTAMPTTSRNNEATPSNTNQPFRSQHVQRASHFLGSLVPRMQHLLGAAGVGSTSVNPTNTFAPSVGTDYHHMPHMRILNLMEELRSDNEIRQSEACSELSDMLLLGNEESLPNFPIRELILCLMTLLNKDHNFELMLSASRCITNLQEALPRSHAILVEAIPILLQKLKRIEYIDVAEQALIILEVISRRNAKNILAASGVQAVTSHVDFFSLPTQRLAFQIAANCASYVTNSEFHKVQDCLADLTQRLSMDDKRCVESICTFFNRLIENLRYHPNRLRQVAGANYELIRAFQRMLVMQPLTISSSTFVSLLKSLRYAATCSDLSVAMFYMDFSKTLRFLLVGAEKKIEQPSIEATIRPAQQLREIANLIGELLPKLPSIGVFAINEYLEQYSNPTSFIQSSRHKSHASNAWYYKTSGDLADAVPPVEWKQFSSNDQLTIERNRTMGVGTMTLEVDGQLCEINFGAMNRRVISTNEVTPIERRSIEAESTKDERDALLENNFEPFLEFVGVIFPLLVEIGSNSTCSNLRYDCLRIMIRMIYAVQSNEKLLTFLKDLPLAAYISSTLSSSKNVALVALAVQLANVLLEKMPNIYIPFFEAEGVFFELKQKAISTPLKKTPIKSSSTSTAPKPTSSSSSPAADKHKSTSSSSQLTEQFRIGNHLDTSAAAALSRLLQQQVFQTASQSQTDMQNQISSALASMTDTNPTISAQTPALRYAPPAQPFSLEALNNRSVIPNLFLPSGALQSSAASSLYQTLTNAVNQSYSQAANYSLNMSSLGNQIDATTSSSHSSTSASLLKSAAAEKLDAFIRTESLSLATKYSNTSATSESMLNMNTLSEIAQLLTTESLDVGFKPLHDLRDVLLTRELSAFQINYSGIITSLISYLTEHTGKLQPPRFERLRRFASTFMLLNENIRPVAVDESTFAAFNCLISKVLLAVERLEQFNVRITNLSGNLASLSGSSSFSSSSSNTQSLLGSSTYLRGAQALRFFQSHQIRCNLRRHPSCKVLREWRRGRGSIKVDPFTSISAIERYLIDRGIGTASQDDSNSDNEELSDDDRDTGASSSASFKGRIEILIGDNLLPSDMSILQAIQRYSLPQDDAEDQETIPPSVWISGHTLYYRAIVDEEDCGQPSTSGQSSSLKPSVITKAVGSSSLISEATSSSSHRRSSSPSRKSKTSRLKKSKDKASEKRSKEDKKEKAVIIETKPLAKIRNLERYLSASLEHPLEDPCERGLVLLRVLFGLNNYWWYLYDDGHTLPNSHLPIIPQSCFHSAKLNSKVSRQLSDFLTVATQQIPRWTKSLVRAVPFVFPFITRRNFLYCTAFGRDRALMHLVNEANPDDHDSESNSRLVPRLERRKITINRSSLLKDAQQSMNQLGASKPLLEVSFDGEVGTGFGPTLEFYSTLSREIQKHTNKLWHGTPMVNNEDGESVEYTSGENGLYPVITRQPSASRSWDSRTKRFEFIGRLMAQTLLDSRILDIPLASPFFTWLLGEHDTMGLAELEQLEPTIYNSLRQIGKLEADDFASFDMTFTYPGNDNFELLKGGKNKPLTYENYRQFAKLICQWRLVDGVLNDMEAVQRGFQQVINIDHLAIFESNEMEGLFCGCSESTDDSVWSRATLQQAIRPDHGYTHDSIQITWLIDMLMSFNREERRKFLQFVTGSPRLPIGGIRALHPPLTVVRKIATDSELPSAMTCYNYLKIPNYETYETFHERFQIALQHIYSFHLT